MKAEVQCTDICLIGHIYRLGFASYCKTIIDNSSYGSSELFTLNLRDNWTDLDKLT